MRKNNSLRFGIDLGGTTAKLAVVTPQNKILLEGSVSSSGSPSPNVLAQKIARESLQMMIGKKISSIGVGVAGDIDFHRGIIRVSPNLGWKNVPLKSLLQKKLGRPVIVDNDANVAAWGIYKTQVSSTVKNMLVVTLGTGVGGGIILDGEIFRGSTGSAGEIGHMTMVENGRRCNCGNRGCLETIAGGTHIVALVKEHLKKGVKSSLQSLYRLNSVNITPRAVAIAAEKGDGFAKKIWNDVGHFLGVAMGNYIYLNNPEVICFTGGVAQARGLVTKPLLKTLKTRAFKTPISAARIMVAKEAAHIGVVGAALL